MYHDLAIKNGDFPVRDVHGTRTFRIGAMDFGISDPSRSCRGESCRVGSAEIQCNIMVPSTLWGRRELENQHF